MRVGCLIRSYRLTGLLRAVLKQYEWVDEIVVMNHRFAGVPESTDNTEDIAKGFRIDKGSGLTEAEVFNKGLELLIGCDRVFISDADEFITRKDQEIILSLAKEHDEILIPVIDYYDLETIISHRGHRPVVLAKPGATKFYEVRNIFGGYSTDKATMHHFGYAWRGKPMAWKSEVWAYRDFTNRPVNGFAKQGVPQEIKDLINDNGCSLEV
jgi:hypothetical protein